MLRFLFGWLILTFFCRGLFIIDGKGTLRQITMNDLPVGRSVDETLRLVQAFQHTDENGEVCPANWEPGKETVSLFRFDHCCTQRLLINVISIQMF